MGDGELRRNWFLGVLLLTSHLTPVVSELVRGRNEVCGLAETAPLGIFEGSPIYLECLEGAHGACKAIGLEHERHSTFDSHWFITGTPGWIAALVHQASRN